MGEGVNGPDGAGEGGGGQGWGRQATTDREFPCTGWGAGNARRPRMGR